MKALMVSAFLGLQARWPCLDWTFSLDSTQLTNGAHTITIRAKDTSNN